TRPEPRLDRPRSDRRRAGAARARHRRDPLRQRAGRARSRRVRGLRGARISTFRQDRGLPRLAATGGPGTAGTVDPAREPTTAHSGAATSRSLRVVTAIRSAFRYFFEHDGFFLAAGLSFYVVICIVPFVLLVIAGSAFLISNEMVLRGVVERLG